jgi:cis-3-alkyl-4-acyloxetan-2-one decarboxylase
VGVVNNLYPFKSTFMDLEGLKYHYLDEGSGAPVVMLHGNPTWSFYYRNLVLALRDSYRVIVPDHIGCGLSDKPGDDRYSYTLKRRVEDLERLLSHCGVTEKITLIVHDWGGMIGMLYAARNTGAVERFVIMNTAAFRLPEGKPFPLPLWLIRNTPLGAFLVRGLNAFCLGAAAFCCTRKELRGEVRRGFLSPYDSWENRIAILRFVQDIPLKPGDASYSLVCDVEKKFPELAERPFLIFWGERDFIFNGRFLEEWIQRVPKATVHRFADAGHYVLEDAGDEIIPLIRDFLPSHRGEGKDNGQ